MNPAKVLFHPITLAFTLIGVGATLIPAHFNVGTSWTWLIAGILALSPVLTAQIKALYGNSTVPVNQDQFHYWIVILTALAAIVQTIQALLETIPASLAASTPGFVIPAVAVLFGVLNAAANQLQLDETGQGPAKTRAPPH